jgi:DNA-binding MarR family transcriptional regulator
MSKPDLSSAELGLAADLHRATLRLARQLRSTRVSGALSNSKLVVLGLLQRNGPATGAALAGELGIQPQSLTRLLAALEAERLIGRHPDADDRRQNLIRITARGGEALGADMLERRRRLAEAMSRVLTPAEREVLRVASEIIEQVAAAIAPAGADRVTLRDAAE